MNKHIARNILKNYFWNTSLILIDKEIWIIEFEIKAKDKYIFQWYKIKIIDLLKLCINNRWLFN